MNLYYTKRQLYQEVDKLKRFFGIPACLRRIDLLQELSYTGIVVKELNFKTPGLRGMAIAAEKGDKDIILLNSARNRTERNFDCGHEVMHLGLHRRLGRKTFNCFEKVHLSQDQYLEWHANEGAAQFFVPHRLFIPAVADRYSGLKGPKEIAELKSDLVQMFNVPTAVIEYRLNNLKYEIDQHIRGVPVNELEILSIHEQRRRNINVRSINEIAQNYINL